ncbi:hypothetical protein DYB32_006034 [Aphanomyces invadans]|uniref:Aminotransferase class I/classII large domain-containing protein n=1 Tax=Aphanomyces invadans TaxID=157072 RepID=A0A418AST5_9STRA|nr:hypothetical protein DYB32_006034 [Aphanomyces invadans]
MPNPTTFPFESMSIKLKSGQTMDLRGPTLQQALQYSPTPGLPELVQIISTRMEDEHEPPALSEPRMLSITTGSQDALYKAFEMLIDEDDSLLVETPTYSGTLAHLHAVNCNLVTVRTDGQGLVPEHLASILDNWDSIKKKPKVLYTIPTGGNPTGVSMSFERKQQVYAIASKHNLIVLEDDPYYYLTLNGARSKSLLHLDVDGRVMRFDSYSKILSSGLRAVVLQLFKQWGEKGWNEHVEAVCMFYRGQRDAFLRALDKNLTGLATWEVPDAGMFVWIKLLGVDDSKALIEQKAVASKVLLVPGQVFLPENVKTSYVRAAYSTATPEQMDLALSRLAALLQDK